MAEWITITSGDLTASINPFGAELSSLKDANGCELMTDADPNFWSGRAPILFPVVGRLSGDVIRVDGRQYPMKQHGFARRLPFALTDHATDRATFTLADNDETRAQYPFAFRLDITFRIDAATLHTDVTVHNPGDAPLPASFGFHPAFAWPLPYGEARADHSIIFSAEEPDALKSIAHDGTIAKNEVSSPLDGRTLRLTDELFAHDALVWDNVRSERVTYVANTGPRLDIAFPDTPKLGIWTKPGAHFVCIEPWHGIADPENYTGEYRDKPGVFEIAPGGSKRIGMNVTLVAEP